MNLHNCTVVNGPTEPPSGRAYNVVARVSGGVWSGYGQLNSSPDGAIPCDDANNPPPTVKVDFAGQAGDWELRAIKIPRSDEPACDSTNPEPTEPGVVACSAVQRFFTQDSAAPWAEVYLTTSDE